VMMKILVFEMVVVTGSMVDVLVIAVKTLVDDIVVDIVDKMMNDVIDDAFEM